MTLIVEVEGKDHSYLVDVSEELAREIAELDLDTMRERLMHAPPAKVSSTGAVDLYVGRPEDTDAEDLAEIREALRT